MREIAIAVALALTSACSADVERVVVYEGQASAAECIEQCVAMDAAECPREPALFYEECVESCYAEAEMQPAECVAAFEVMWSCRVAEMVVVCSSIDEPVATYDGRCTAESSAYADCAAERIRF